MKKTLSLFDSNLLQTAARDALKRLSPRYQLKNPVMFVVWLGSLLTSGLFIQAMVGRGDGYGSRCCSLTLPRRWRKGAARRRRRHSKA